MPIFGPERFSDDKSKDKVKNTVILLFRSTRVHERRRMGLRELVRAHTTTTVSQRQRRREWKKGKILLREFI